MSAFDDVNFTVNKLEAVNAIFDQSNNPKHHDPGLTFEQVLGVNWLLDDIIDELKAQHKEMIETCSAMLPPGELAGAVVLDATMKG